MFRIYTMSLVAAFALPSESFVLGDALEIDEIESIEFACNIPTRIGVMPYFWVWGSSFDGFEKAVRTEPSIDTIEKIDSLEDSRLYRTEWKTTVQGLLDAIRTNNGILKSAVGEDRWEFEIVFEEHNDLSAFGNQCSEIGFDIDLQYVHSLTEPMDEAYGLTPAQRETLVTAERGGYFDEPRNLTMDELATKLDISPAAVSGRLRRGVSNLIQRTLISDE